MDMNSSLTCLHAHIYGRVQGVNFRYYTMLQAQALDVAGWVANLSDGAVELMAEGDRASLDKLLAWLREGPGHARVERVEAEWLAPSNQFERFQIKYL